MKKIKYLWENWGLRHIHDDQLDFLKMTVDESKVVLVYGKDNFSIREVHPFQKTIQSLNHYFNELSAIKASEEFGIDICDGWNETLWVDEFELSHLPDHPLVKHFMAKVCLLIQVDIMETCSEKFKKIYQPIIDPNFNV